MDRDGVVLALKEGEKTAAIKWRGSAGAARPLTALRELVEELRQSEGATYELKATGLDRTSQIMLLTLCGRYGLRAIHRKGQRHNTVVLQGPETFLEEVLWPLFNKQTKFVVQGLDAWLHDILTTALVDEDVAAVS